MLAQHGYSLQAPSKQAEGTTHPDRDGQFRYLAELVDAFIGTGDPVISVDTKKKELLGNKSNGGTEYQPKATRSAPTSMTFLTRRWAKPSPMACTT